MIVSRLAQTRTKPLIRKRDKHSFKEGDLNLKFRIFSEKRQNTCLLKQQLCEAAAAAVVAVIRAQFSTKANRLHVQATTNRLLY